MRLLRSPKAEGGVGPSPLDPTSPPGSGPGAGNETTPADGDVPPLHTRAAGLWLAAALAPALLSSNPWHLLVVATAAAVSYGAWSRRGGAPGWGLFLRFGLLLIAFTVLLQPLASSAGETVIATLPALRLGPLVLGGPVTLESLAYGAARGLALAAVLLTFAAFSAAVDPYRLVRSTPRFLHRSAVVLSIALAFVPRTLTAQREIREAMALRGHRFRGLRDLVPLFVALVAGGLERSIDLAEAMEARGFGAVTEDRRPAAGRALDAALALGLALAVGGVYARTAWPQSPLAGGLGAAAIALGALAVAAALMAIGRGVRATRYRPERWSRRDALVAAAAAIALAAFAAAWRWRGSEMFFYPYPRLEAPALSPWLAAALALLAAPAVAAFVDRGAGEPTARARGGPSR